ncbi:MAG: complex I NDUFA9 subunit family protein [Sphingomicrobium sp.]
MTGPLTARPLDPARSPDASPKLVTVIGGGGFIGRYVCEALLRQGVRLRVAQRDVRAAYFLQPLAAVGQLGFVATSLTNRASLDRACDGATAVINLVGILKGKFDAIHVEGARHAAEAATTAGASAFVQVSAIGADPASPSAYGRSKAQGEAAVRAAFPTATIIRPSLVFGREDQLTNRFAQMARLPFLPVIAGATKFQPVYVADLAQAIAAAALDPASHGGKIYEIGGPEVMTMRALNECIAALAGQSPEIAPVPDFVAELLAKFGFLPGAPLTRDQWAMLQTDNIVAPGTLGLDAFGITPTPLAAVAPAWLDRFRKGGRFAPRKTDTSASL